MTVRTLILKTAGINCDEELAHAFRLAGSEVESVHINELKSGQKRIRDFDILGFPGGFAYGDDLSAGRVLATEVTASLLDSILEFYDQGGLIIGICNGFQTLVKARLLPDTPLLRLEPDSPPRSTLFWNDSGKFEDRWITLRVEPDSRCVWTRGMPELIELPIAHAEGKFIPSNDEVLDELASNGQIVVRYCDPANPEFCMHESVEFPMNPNGSVANIAGICDSSGRVFGLMPHPERFTDPTNHPRWCRKRSIGRGDKSRVDGLPFFKNAVDYIKGIKKATSPGASSMNR
jgi:phosphoribosylformylglycinamidine synthase subunit PurQ / glutaminase